MRTLQSLLLVAFLGALPSTSHAQINISITIGPPALPVYEQPICPTPNWMWAPGYWAYDGEGGYFWVPGTWVQAPQPGLLWTPGYWSWGSGGFYSFHPGYWAPHVGYYGGVNYGYGYGGSGFGGGEWRGGNFAYNTATTRVNTTVIHNTYINNTYVTNTTVVNRTSFNGGPNGIAARPTAQEQAYASERHTEATPAQTQHANFARQDRANYASVNHGAPAHVAVSKPVSSPEDFKHAVAAKGATPAEFQRVTPGSLPKPAAAAAHPAPAQHTAAPAKPAGQQHPEPGHKPAPPTHAAKPGPHPEQKPAQRREPEGPPR